LRIGFGARGCVRTARIEGGPMAPSHPRRTPDPSRHLIHDAGSLERDQAVSAKDRDSARVRDSGNK